MQKFHIEQKVFRVDIKTNDQKCFCDECNIDGMLEIRSRGNKKAFVTCPFCHGTKSISIPVVVNAIVTRDIIDRIQQIQSKVSIQFRYRLKSGNAYYTENFLYETKKEASTFGASLLGKTLEEVNVLRAEV